MTSRLPPNGRSIASKLPLDCLWTAARLASLTGLSIASEWDLNTSDLSFAPRTAYRSSRVVQRVSLIARRSSRVSHRVSFIACRLSRVVDRVSLIACRSSRVVERVVDRVS